MKVKEASKRSFDNGDKNANFYEGLRRIKLLKLCALLNEARMEHTPLGSLYVLCIFVQCHCSARDGYALMLSWRVSPVAFRTAIKKL